MPKSLIVQAAREARTGNGISLVVLAGEEPFRHNVTPLMHALCDAGFHVLVETSGACAPARGHYTRFPPMSEDERMLPGYVSLCVTPTTSRINGEVAQFATFYRYLVSALTDRLHYEAAGDLDRFGLHADDGLPWVWSEPSQAWQPLARPGPLALRHRVYVLPMRGSGPQEASDNMTWAMHLAGEHGYRYAVPPWCVGETDLALAAAGSYQEGPGP
jgi:hypothetical protein